MAHDVRAFEGMAQNRVLKASADAAKRQRALDLLAEGLTCVEVGVEVGLQLGRNRKVIARWRQEAHGGPKSVRQVEMDEARALREQKEAAKKQRALAMLSDGVPMDEIGRILGMCEKTLAKWKAEASGEG